MRLGARNCHFAALITHVEGQRQAPVSLARDVPVAHVLKPVLHALTGVFGYPLHLAGGTYHARAYLLRADIPLGCHAEHEVGAAAPADRVAVSIVHEPVEQALLLQRVEYHRGHIGHVMARELAVLAGIVAVLVY